MSNPNTEVVGRLLKVELIYPTAGKNVNEIEIDLCCTRAADGIRISYDYERDGWVVKQASTFSWKADDKVMDEDWQEVAFIQAWGRKKPGPHEAALEAHRKSQETQP